MNSAFLIGQRVYLRPVEKQDAVLIHKWSNDPQIRCLTGEVTPTTLTDTEEYIRHVVK